MRISVLVVNQSLGFRKDIQGLRGLAVALVVIEHATPYVPGGYIGVDVFFVISGYVITQLLMREIDERGQISLKDFYSRRIRRLVPALSIVLLFTLVASVFVLSPGLEQEKLVSAAFASFFFIANIRYISEGGYFFLQSDPLRHLWSLGVEEQFYLVYPILMILALRVSKSRRISFARLMLALLVVISVVSFCLGSLLAYGVRILPLPSRLSFFGTPFRFWELMFGGILALVLVKRPLVLSGAYRIGAQVAGYLLILVPAFTYGPFTLFPGITAVPPVLGTTLLILSGSNESHFFNLMTWKMWIFLGDISYGLYLWHWPLIVFVERLYPENFAAVLMSVGVAILLSSFQLRFVETPIRFRQDIVGKVALKLFGITTVILLAVGGLVVGLSRSGLNLDNQAQFDSMQRFADNCSYPGLEEKLNPKCTSESGGPTRLLLIGDSQAAALADGFVAVAESLGAAYSVVFANSCPIHLRPNELRESCAEFQNSVPGIIKEFKPTVVVVANASDLYVTRGGFGKPDTQIRREDGSLPKNYQEALDNWTSGVRGAMVSDSLMKLPLIYVQMVPISPIKTATLLRPVDNLSTFSLADGFDRNLIVEAEAETFSDLPRVAVLDPARALCPDGRCQLTHAGKPIYNDLYHLNPRGAMLLAPDLQQLVQSLSK
jgi:peptidoglycan/LPS O-acetylase OafA/YrhL